MLLVFTTNSTVTGKGWEIYYPKSNLGVDENRMFSDVQLFPNPSHDKVTIGFTSAGHGQTMVTVSDVHGKVILSRPVVSKQGKNSMEIQTAGLEPGIYSVTIGSDTQRAVKKLVIY